MTSPQSLLNNIFIRADVSCSTTFTVTLILGLKLKYILLRYGCLWINVLTNIKTLNKLSPNSKGKLIIILNICVFAQYLQNKQTNKRMNKVLQSCKSSLHWHIRKQLLVKTSIVLLHKRMYSSYNVYILWSISSLKIGWRLSRTCN